MKNNIVFIDRDGTINEDIGYVFKVEDFKLLPGSLEALQELTRLKVLIYIITNQAGIGKGYYTETEFHFLTNYMLDFFSENRIEIEKVLYCPHHPDAVVDKYRLKCTCRKPGVGLFENIITGNKNKISNVALIGDKNTDIQAGSQMGISTYLVETGYGNFEKSNTQANFIVPDLQSAVRHLANQWNLN